MLSLCLNTYCCTTALHYLTNMKLLILFSIIATTQASPWIPVPRNETAWYRIHDQFINNTIQNRSNISVLFYGDSITRDWAAGGKDIFEEKYAPLGAATYGIGGDKVEHLLYRVADREVDNLLPKLVVLMIGTNNSPADDTTDDVARGIRAVVDLLLEKLPTAKVLLVGIIPRGSVTWSERIADINIKISKFHDGNRIFFLDMLDQLCSAWATVDPVMYNPDRVHLQTPGYQMWADTMEPIFSKLMQS